MCIYVCVIGFNLMGTSSCGLRNILFYADRVKAHLGLLSMQTYFEVIDRLKAFYSFAVGYCFATVTMFFFLSEFFCLSYIKQKK